ncbi:sarcosine dehydrogenase [Asanoa ishikariensis]|uniref:Dimethylglycine oxidase n=1 Tax=Asanoa ishikariensis TaxID=137265 RepID=A0A1H3TG19_9ACTN|nr:FAD-dependent oxidoreductase [Asanoa ishikariensis]GIF62556.1 sarcosine dehydrogenase [Asanoa ishikariensis]SDZ48791.1 dimethylglycine oxidase [Asanoa ishikariensis]
MTAPRVVIIGAGVVGAALADELSALGWTDVTVVEQGGLPRPGGSSSHAPGLVFQTNSAKVMTRFAQYTIDKLTRLGCFSTVGSLEVATSEARLADLHRRHGWLTAWGGTGRVLDPAECVRHHSLLDTVLGGLHVPGDGLANSVQAVSAQLSLAQERGVRVLDGHEVLDIRAVGDRVRGVVTSRGELPADVVVCCAGIWGQRIARMVGVNLPLTPLAHQFGWTGPLRALARPRAEAVRPILRHQDADLYLRERFDRIGVGYYGHRPMPVSVDDIAPGPTPSVLPFTPDDFEPGWTAAQDLLPVLREAKIEEGMNGLFSFTTDNMPLLGPSAAVDGLWFAEAVWVTHSAGVARAVAEWLVRDHSSSFDLHECDLNRFEPHQLAPDYVLARDCQNYIEVYDVIHPSQPMAEPRPMRTTPFYPRQLDAEFLEFAGWERPQWYGRNEALLAGRDIPLPNDWAARYWSPIVGAEALATRESVALYDMTPLKRVEVTGPGAAAYLQWLTTGNVDRSVGTVTYCLLLDVDGGIRSDITVARLGPHEFQVGINGPLDVDWFVRHLPADGSVAVRDTTAGTCCIGVWGPRARDLVQSLTADDFSNEGFRYFRARRSYIGVVPVTALRLSYVGELGYELYTTAELGLKLWDTLWSAGQPLGVVAGGRGAFASLRLEKGYRLFGTDMTYEHDPYEAGLGFAVKLDKGDFLGRSALLGRSDPVRRLTCLTLPEVVMGKEPVYAGGSCVGHVTSAAYGYTVGTGIAYAWLPADLATPGRTVHIGYFDRLVPATVAAEPLFDPRMERLRG